MSFPSIADDRLTPGKAAKQQLFEDLAARDDDNESAGSAPAADLLDENNTGHSHDGSSGEGQLIETQSVANGGIWKSEHIADLAAERDRIAPHTMDTADLAPQAAGAQKFTGSSSTGLTAVKGFASPVLNFDPDESETAGAVHVEIRSGGPFLVVNRTTGGWFILENTSDRISFGLIDRTSATTWSIECDLM